MAAVSRAPIILLVDGNAANARLANRVLSDRGMVLRVAPQLNQAHSMARSLQPDLIMLSASMAGEDAFAIVKSLHLELPHAIILLVVDRFEGEKYFPLFRAGGSGMLVSSRLEDELKYWIGQPIQRKRLPNSADSSVASPILPSIDRLMLTGDSEVAKDLWKQIAAFAYTELPLLIVGEPGTGRTEIAEAVHAYSTDSELVPLRLFIDKQTTETDLDELLQSANNSAASATLPFDNVEQTNALLAESEKPSKYPTIILDGLQDASPRLQAKLLNILFSHSIYGNSRATTAITRYRFIGITDPSILELVALGQFSRELFHKWGACSIFAPPLRSRRQDLPSIVHLLLNQFQDSGVKYFEGVSLSIDEDALVLLQDHFWPGNRHELHSILLRCSIESQGRPIVADQVATALRGQPRIPLECRTEDHQSSWKSFVEQQLAADSCSLYEEAIRETEYRLISEVLRVTDCNQVQAAKRLGITRGSLRKKMKDLGIRIEHLPSQLEGNSKIMRRIDTSPNTTLRVALPETENAS